MDLTIFKKLGLSDKETKAYLGLLNSLQLVIPIL